MWTYSQSTGHLSRDGVYVATGYAGHPPHVNDPNAQNASNVGPLPQGAYTIGAAFWSAHLGPLAMYLDPDKSNEMFGRGGFYIHGDSIQYPGFASNGCIVMAHEIRAQISTNKDKQLTVTA